MVERLGGDEDLARDLVILFLGEYPNLMNNLRASVRSGNADAVRRAAHAAKGCIANFIDGGPQTTAYRIEQLGAEGRLSEVAPLLVDLEQQVAALVRDMAAFKRGASERGASCAS
jgi:HPt (histidine-containing phosphotransfer) domain-containing protein